ncbi:hypothetical protein A1Q2_00748 [Trichosporon asahii var. asahii CBS 8904]|uniref:Uncharacterized protein n=1 Tax=Trichosporon asahii var. asahii (strain CBS 8904) TaxID=1220162 RepID=K1W7S8_TRIAC|nr:hypothetical protein A1Q2_00748 [Trichosporon asahii var. asahii CBS 8904]
MDIDLFSPIHNDDTTVVQAGNAQSANAEDDSSVSPESAGPSVTCELCQLHRIFAGKAWIHVHMKQRRDCFTILLDDDGTAYYGRILDQATMQQHQVEPESRPRRAVTVTRHLQMYRRIIAAIRGLDSRLSLLSRFPEDIDSPPPLLEQNLEATDPIPITTLLPQPLRGQLRPFAESPGTAPSSPHPLLSLGIPAPPPKPSEAEETSRRTESRSEVPAPRSERQVRGDKALIWTGRTCSQCIRDERQQQFRSFVHIHSPGLLICTTNTVERGSQLRAISLHWDIVRGPAALVRSLVHEAQNPQSAERSQPRRSNNGGNSWYSGESEKPFLRDNAEGFST